MFLFKLNNKRIMNYENFIFVNLAYNNNDDNVILISAVKSTIHN